MSGKLKYGNWIRKKNLWLLGFSSLSLGILTLLPFPLGLRIVTGSLCIILAISFLYPLYAYVMFASWGGNIQEKIYELIIAKLGLSACDKILDVGAGNGVLAVKLAQRFSSSMITGMDYWGKDWEYAKSVCEANARIVSVAERVQFVKGDAARLDFTNAEFDAIVSNLTFHEVRSVVRKTDVVKESLRVLKPGGVFAFVDYFYESRFYGQPAEFKAELELLGLTHMTIKPLREELAIPMLLQHPKALGKVGILYGQK
jgi:SAM-dependent methyltransferase